MVLFCNGGIVLVVSHADEVGVKVVHVSAGVSAAVAPPGVALAVKPPVEKVQGLVGEFDHAEVTLVLARLQLHLLVLLDWTTTAALFHILSPLGTRRLWRRWRSRLDD